MRKRKLNTREPFGGDPRIGRMVEVLDVRARDSAPLGRVSLSGSPMNPSNALEDAFLHVGMQYYITARSAALANLLNVCGNLYHHAIEMLLKAVLSRRYSVN